MMKYVSGNRNPKVIAGKRKIACVGDSITFGHGVNGKTEKTWEYTVNQILGESFQVINYGASGRTVQTAGDYPYTSDKIFEYSLECGAETYLILLGTNDAKPWNWDQKRFEKDYESFIKRYIELPGKPEVILMTPPQCFPDETSGIVPYGIRKDVIDRFIVKYIGETAERLRLPVIDLYEYTKDHSEWFTDGVHPNEKGNRAIGEFIAVELNKLDSMHTANA